MLFRRNKPRRTWAIWENTVMAFQTLRDRSFRSLLTVIGVSIGVIIIIGVASVLNGFRQNVVDNFASWGTSNVFVTRFPLMSMSRPSREIRKRKHLTLQDAEAIREECPAVLAVSPEKFDSSNVKYGNQEMMNAQLRGAFAEARDVHDIKLSEGRFYTSEENRLRASVCVIGASVSETLFARLSPIGKTIALDGKRLRVIGVMEKSKNSTSGEESSDDTIIYLPYTVFRDMHPYYDDNFIIARARPGQLRLAIEQIEEVLRKRRHVAWKDPNDFEVNTFDSMVASFDKIVFATLAVMFALSTVAFMVGGVGVMNVMFASVKERTREIGIRRAIGARRRDIIWQFLTEAMAMTGGGGLIGVLIGEGIMRGLFWLMPAMPNTTPMWARLFGFFGSVGVGLVFGLWPAIQAAHLDPIKALRYE